MPLPPRLKREFDAVLFTTAFFGVWIGTLFVIKCLLLAQYSASGYDVGKAAFGVLLLAKVVVVLERVPLGSRAAAAARPAWVDVLMRTAFYAVGVFIALLIERGLRGMSQHDGFLPAIEADFRRAGAHHIAANAISITGGLLVFNALCVVRRNLGHGALRTMFLAPTPREAK